MEPDEFLEYLRVHGGPTARETLNDGVDVDEIRRAQAANRAAESERLREASLGINGAAERLSVTPDQVAEMLQRGALWSYPEARIPLWQFTGETRIPLWQFARDGLIPHLDKVVAAIPPDWSPSDIEAAMTLADEEFDNLSPIQWLIHGGDPTVVAARLTALPYTY